MIVDFPDRFEALVHRAEIVYQETMKRLSQEGGLELVAAFQCVDLINWIRLHDTPTEAMIEFSQRVEAICGPMPVFVAKVSWCDGHHLVLAEGNLMQEVVYPFQALR